MIRRLTAWITNMHPRKRDPQYGAYVDNRIPDKPEIVCLCGSTRFMDAFFDEGWRLTLEGKIVLSIGVCKHAEDHGGEALGQEVADMLDELHLRKIDLADTVLILNVDGYIGESTGKKLLYAYELGKTISYLEPITINKAVQFGRPCIAGTGIPTEIVYERYTAGETVTELARDYGIMVEQIKFAIRYEEVVR